MRISKATFPVTILWLALNACKPSTHTLPAVTSLNNFKQTAFVATLQNELPPDKNIIYAPTLLYAWHELKTEMVPDWAIPKNASADFVLLNSSKSFINSLNKNEYETKTDVSGTNVTAGAYFSIALPFAHSLDTVHAGISFDNKRVLAFGRNPLNFNTNNPAKILYYKDDDNFILKLIPKDTQHEIILVKGLKKTATFYDVLKQTTDWITASKGEQKTKETAWKYEFSEADSFAIPTISLNLETHYKTLEGQSFFSRGKQYVLQTVWQRTAFRLDENGAIVESEVVVAAADSASSPGKIHPKNMVFDKPFFIIIKKVDKTNPYCMMRIKNAELLTQLKKQGEQ